MLSSNIILTYVLIDRSNSDLAQIVDVDKPLEASVLEMATIIRDGFTEIVSYIDDQNEHHLIKIETARSDFERYVAKYLQLDRSEKGQHLVASVERQYEEFKKLTDETTKLAQLRYGYLAPFEDNLQQIDDLLNVDISGLDPDSSTQLSIAAALKMRIGTASAALQQYIFKPEAKAKQELLYAKQEFRYLLEQYRKLSAGAENRQLRDEINKRFILAFTAGDEAVDLTDSLQTTRARLRTAVSQVLTALDDLMRALIESNSNHVAGVEYSLSIYLIFVTVMTVLIFLVVGGAIVTTTVSINRGIGRLLRGTYQIRRGELNHRIELDGKDEFGLLADAFNEMLEYRNRAEEERNRIETLLLHSQKMDAVGQLAGGVAHDFNNILTVISGNIELINDEVKKKLGQDTILNMLKKVADSANQAAMLTQQLLVFTRRDVVKLEALDLNKTLGEVEKILRRLIPESVVINIKLAAEIPLIYADPGQITQVIVNLAVNANEAMPDGGTLTIETSNVVLSESYVKLHADAHIGRHIRLSVSDTGQGMDEAIQKHIFEPFFTTKPVGQGSGLGLATVYGIVVDKCNGHILFDSQEGQGSNIMVYLPAMAESADDDSEATTPSTLIGGNDTILVCEDNEMVRELMVSILSKSGYTVLAAEKASKALKLAAEHESAVQLLITDVIMPEMNGKELADVLTALNPDLKTIFTSGYVSNVIGTIGMPGEDVEFIEKPFSRDTLLERVQRVLNRQQYKQLAG